MNGDKNRDLSSDLSDRVNAVAKLYQTHDKYSSFISNTYL